MRQPGRSCAPIGARRWSARSVGPRTNLNEQGERKSPMNRDAMLQALTTRSEPWDILVIGGGATGLGVAVDAAARGYRTVLVEQDDFAKGTSSRSTKLAHGGVRYLRSGEVGLVRGALRERGLLERNAPHLVHRRGFVIPIYRWRDLPLYGFGLKAYE